MLEPLFRTLNGKSSRNAMWILVGQVLRLGVQALCFVLISRNLGPLQYGAFVAVVAAAGIAAPFVGLGAGNLLVKNVARDPAHFSLCWGNGITATIASGTAAVVLIFAGSAVLFPEAISAKIVLYILLADLVFSPLLWLSSMVFQAFEVLRNTVVLNLTASATRLIGAYVVIANGTFSVTDWVLIYLLTSAGTAIVSLLWVTGIYGKPSLRFSLLREEFTEGLLFSVGTCAFNIYSDIDKSMLAKLATLDAAGIYAAAVRLIDIGLIPIRSVATVTYAKMFLHGVRGLEGTLAYAAKLLRKVAWYPVLSFLFLFALAPIVPKILGGEYSQTTIALRWLAIIPLIRTFQYFAADALTGAGFQGARTVVQVAVAVMNILLNLWLIPRYSWQGAAWSSVACDACLALALWSLAIHLRGQERSAALS